MTGIDPASGLWCRAAVDDDTGRPVITRLSEGKPADPDTGDLSGRTVVAVPDSEVQIKRLHQRSPVDESSRNRLLYELVQSVLEEEQAFVYDVHPAGNDGNWFGLIFRRRSLEQLSLDCGLAGAEITPPPGYLPRSLALGRAYLKFCRREEGDLVCLADLVPGAASISFVRSGEIIDLASLTLRKSDYRATAEREQLAVDLKTIVSFRLSSLLDRGVSTPLSALILSGAGIDDEVRQVVCDYFPVGVKAPSFNTGYLADPIREITSHHERFLVALGLTVN